MEYRLPKPHSDHQRYVKVSVFACQIKKHTKFLLAYYTWAAAAAAVDVGNHSCTGLTNVFDVHCGASNNGDAIRLLQRTSRKCMVIRKISVHAVGPSYPSCFFYLFFMATYFCDKERIKNWRFQQLHQAAPRLPHCALYVQQSACGRRTRKESGSRLPSNISN